MLLKKATAFLVFFICMLLSINPVSADSETARKTVRVGYPMQAGLTEVDDNGDYSGYIYDYLQEIAQYTGWQYEFVQVPGNINESLHTMLDMLQNKELDLLGGWLYTEEMAEKYDYSSYSIGMVYTVLSVLSDNTDFWFFDSKIGQKVRIAVLKNSDVRITELTDYCKMNHITPELIECADSDEQLEALREGRADALLANSISPIEGTRNVVKFSPRPFYYIMSKGNDSLLSELNSAINSIEQTDPYFTATLYEKYFSNQPDALVLSDEEKDYIERGETVRTGMMYGIPPFQYVDDKQNLRGISKDLLDYVSTETGLQFDIISYGTQAELETLLKEGKIDLIAGMSYDYEYAHSIGAAMTRPYVSSQYVLMIHPNVSEDSLQGKRLAIPDSSFYSGYFIGNVVRYATQEDCIRAVSQGKADYTYADSYIAQFYVNQPEFSTIRLIPQTYGVHKTCFGVTEPVSKPLLGILNKIILHIPDETIQSFIYQNTGYQHAYSLSQWMKLNPLESILSISILFFCVIGILLWGLVTRVHMNRKISLEMQKYTQIYHLASERFFEFDCRTNEIMVSTQQETQKKESDTVAHYKLGLESGSSAYAGRFGDFLKSQEDGVVEMNLASLGGEDHWIRFTLKTISDNGKPAYIIGKAADIDEERRERELLLTKAQRDSLTHLYNAETCRVKITESIKELRPGECGGLIIMDIDCFKTINDTYGHMEGDLVLMKTSELMRKIFSEEQVLGRPGGDEFTIYLKRINDRDGLEQACKKLSEQIKTIGFSDKQHITSSIGAVLTKSGGDYGRYYKQADDALYLAKHNGRDRYEIAENI